MSRTAAELCDAIRDMSPANQLRMGAEMLEKGHDRLAHVLIERVLHRLELDRLEALAGPHDAHTLCIEGRPCSAGCPR